MGLLDDAIREHLELKRKHGAAEDDVQRQEAEALGPARRDFAAAPTEQAREAAAPEEVPAASDARAGADPDQPVTETARGSEPGPAAGEPATWLDEEERPPPEAPEPEPHPRRTSDTPTQGFDALSLEDEPGGEEATRAEDGPDGDEDVLEETPEFLQDTPEHDRLWFEQKPPRDFDFDD